MWIVPSKKVIGRGGYGRLEDCFHSSVHSRERETVSRSRSMSSFTPAIPSSVGIRASICGDIVDVGVGHVVDVLGEVTRWRDPEFLRVPGHPVLDVAALVVL